MNITSNRLKVWEVKEQNGFRKLNLGDSRKDKTGEYKNFTWFDCLIVGNAKNVPVQKGDIIKVTSGIISKREYNGKYYDDIVIFELEVTQPSGNSGQSQEQNGFEDDIPF